MENTTPTQALTQQNPNNTMSVIAVVGIVLLGVAFAMGYYVGSTQFRISQIAQKMKPSASLKPSVSPRPLVSPSPKVVVEVLPPPQKRLFDTTEKWFINQPYPTELLTVPESQLVGIQCSPKYEGGRGNYFAFPQDDEGRAERYQLTDPDVIKMVRDISKSTGKRVDSFIFCKTLTGSTLFEFEQTDGGGGSKTVAYFGLFNDGTFNQLVELPTPGMPYFWCQNPLQLTTSNQLYFGCGGGDGGFGGSVIYKIDISKKSITEVRRCTSQMDGSLEGITTCE